MAKSITLKQNCTFLFIISH